MDPAIFRENDIRGRVGIDIAVSEVPVLGRAVGTYFRRRSVRRVVVGSDTRPTSRAWQRQIIRGLTRTGCDVVDIGSCLTPCVYFAVRHLAADAGVMVTASHNAAEFNGLKLVVGTENVHGVDLQGIYEIASTEDFVRGRGAEEQVDVTDAYVRALAADLHVSRPLRVGIDAGHGTAASVAAKLLAALGVQAVSARPKPIGFEDGQFLDPAQEDDLQSLARLVRSRALDVGLAFDGDGDRLGVVAPPGVIVPADDLLILFARSVLAAHPGAAVVGEVLCSQRLFDEVARLGGRAIMSKTGHSLVRQRMSDEAALLAGELSGHFFYADRYPASSDAIYAAGRLLEIMSASSQTLPLLLADLPPVARLPQMRIPCDESLKPPVMDAVTRKLREVASASGATTTEIDGIRIAWPDGWAVVRASNTEPAIVVRCEAQRESRLRSIRSLVMSAVDAALRASGGYSVADPSNYVNGDAGLHSAKLLA